MGVYLPNVDMPKGDKCVTIQICPDGSIWQQYRGTVPNSKAVPVTPHGRLGDLGKLAEKIEGIWDCNDLYFQPNDQICDPEDCKGCKWRETWDCFRRMVKHAPTIIPAEDSKLSATIKCGGAVTCAVAYSEEVYGKYTDTAGNLHWTGTHSGEHIVRAEEGET